MLGWTVVNPTGTSVPEVAGALMTENYPFPWLGRYTPKGYSGFFKESYTGEFGTQFDYKLFPTSVERIEGVGPKKFSSTTYANRVEDQSPVLSYFRKARITLNYECLTNNILDDEETVLKIRENASLYSTTTPTNYTSTNVPQEHFLFRNVTKILTPTSEAIRMPTNFYKWAEAIYGDGGLTIVGKISETAAGSFIKLQPKAEVTYVWYQVPANLLQSNNGTAKSEIVNQRLIGAVYTHLGSVNAYDFDGFRRGTLLLTSIEAKPYIWVTGQRYYDYTYKMKYFEDTDVNDRVPNSPNRVIGHNYFLRHIPKAGIEPAYCLITHNGTPTGNPVFLNKDFRLLFTPVTFNELIRMSSSGSIPNVYSNLPAHPA
jgi:hypothetical protein